MFGMRVILCFAIISLLSGCDTWVYDVIVLKGKKSEDGEVITQTEIKKTLQITDIVSTRNGFIKLDKIPKDLSLVNPLAGYCLKDHSPHGYVAFLIYGKDRFKSLVIDIRGIVGKKEMNAAQKLERSIYNDLVLEFGQERVVLLQPKDELGWRDPNLGSGPGPFSELK